MAEEQGLTGFEIAVIGMSARLPGAKNIDQFWDNLKNGVESITFFADEELYEAGIEPGLVNNPNYIKAKGVLEDIQYFDSFFFDYSPYEAEIMDPQMRIFHEIAWEALENAGYVPETFNGAIGFYAGASDNYYWVALSILSGKTRVMGEWVASQLNNKSYLTMRISHKLNLKGPSFLIHTACSTSLAAVHLACQAILTGECDMALAGGISVTFPHKSGYLYQEGMIQSPDGHCRAFDADAAGIIGGNGGGIVVLKRLEEAQKDRDYIHAIIKGSAVNNDGIRKSGFTAPSVEGQVETLRAAQEMAEVEPESIAYIETHGTGTPLGDPIEVDALTIAFNTRKKNYCAIGSVKSNFGHLDAAAGIAGFIKTVLVLKHKLIPPSLHFRRPNPEIYFENSPFYVNAVLKEWKNDIYPLRAGVSSFGIGGTNAHVILEEWPDGLSSNAGRMAQSAEPKAQSAAREYQLMLLSAKTETALDKMTENLGKYLKENPGIHPADAAYTLQVGRKVFPYRRMLVCADIHDTIDILLSLNPGKVRTFYSKGEKENTAVVFMFPGQGSQYVNMGRELYEEEPVFREEADHCFEILEPLMGYDIKEILYPGERKAQGAEPKANKRDALCAVRNAIDQTEITQPVLFVFEYALAKLLMHWGVTPRVLMGHSIGEYAAAALSGVFSLEDALSLVVSRGRLMQQMPVGAMLSVPLCEEELKPLLNEEIALAAVNGPGLCVVSGNPQAVDAFEKKLREKGHDSTRLHTSHAFHSPMMDPILKEFEEKARQIPCHPPGIPYISNVTGKWVTAGEVADPGYWSAHLRETVRFGDGVSELLKEQPMILVEVGPGRVLSTFVRKQRQNSKDKKAAPCIVNLVRHPQENVSDLAYLLNKIGELWLYGKEIDWSGFYSGEKRYRVPLPAYPFERQRYWIDTVPSRTGLTDMELSAERSWLHKKADAADWFYIPMWTCSELEAGNGNRNRGSGRLLFIDACGLGSQLLKQWEKEKEQQEVIVVKPGPGFNRAGEQEYTINPEQSADYHALFKELKASDRLPGHIIHLWNVTGAGEAGGEDAIDEGIEIENMQKLGFYSLLDIARAIGDQGITRQIRLDVVTDSMQRITGKESLCPAKATVLGPVKVIPKEYTNITCRSIDVVLPGSRIVEGEGKNNELISQLFTQLSVETAGHEQVVAYRGNDRLNRTFVPRRLEKSRQGQSRLRERGVYLVTGGLGGIGYVFAEYLVKSVHARVILVGRSQLPPRQDWKEWFNSHDEEEPVSRKIRKVQELERLGGEVLVFNADVSCPERMKVVLEQAVKQWGPLNGVCHTAGVADYAGVIQRRSREANQEILAGKVSGTVVLDSLLKDMPLDFFILCSSLSSLVGAFGEVGYCAANAFLDAFAHYKNKNKTSGQDRFTVSINWDAWQEVGMAREAVKAVKQWSGSKYDAISQHLFTYGLLSSEGIDIFGRILDHDQPLPQVVVSTVDLNMKMKQGEFPEPRVPVKPSTQSRLYQRPELSTTYAAPVNEREKQLAEIWQNHLGIERIGSYDNFFELGANSLDILQVNHQLKEIFNREIPIVVMYTYPTVNALTGYLEQEEAKIGFSPDERERLQRRIRKGEDEFTRIEQKGIAVIGMAGRFPGANSIAEFWENLRNGVESICFFTRDELGDAGIEPGLIHNPHYHYVKAKSIIEEIEYLDADFFNYKPGEARALDPQVRVFLECVWEALESAGYDPMSYHQLIGLYAGASDNLYWRGQVSLSGAEYSGLLLSNKDVLCTQTSYKLDLKGPSFSLQTACSTSLLAIHLACQGLGNGECDLALAGGVSVGLPNRNGYMYEEGMIYSSDGHIRAFDARANGTVFGNGAGVVVLKSLCEAVADGDSVLAVIKGTAINNDGERKVGFTAPSTTGQAEVIRAALLAAGVEAESIGYVETHGTGTDVGDPIEIEALKLAFNTSKKQFCGIGSVKTNIGHLDAAAGVVSFIKTVLALNHQFIPPSLHFETPNPRIDFENSPCYVNREAREWKNNDNPRYPLRAGVSSFGFGGTNVHVVLEEWPEGLSSNAGRMAQSAERKAQSAAKEYQLVLLSAKTSAALGKMAGNLAHYFQQQPEINLADAAYTLQVGRRAFQHRMMCLCETVEQAAAALSSYGSPGSPSSEGAGGSQGTGKVRTSVVSGVIEDKTSGPVIPHQEKYPLNEIGRMWLEGKTIDWQEFYSKQKRHRMRIPLPTYPFERQRYWIEREVKLKEEINKRITIRPNRRLDKKTDIADWFYIPSWKRSMLPKNKIDGKLSSCRWLVFIDEWGIGAGLIKKLVDQGHHMVVVRPGTAFAKVGDEEYMINPRQTNDYHELVKELRIWEKIPDKILHLWEVTGLEKNELTPPGIKKAQEYGFYSLLYLAQAMGNQDFIDEIQMTVVSDNMLEVIGDERIYPGKSTVIGVLKVIPQEYPNIRCRCIDIDFTKPGKVEEKEPVQQLLKEIVSGSADTLVAYRKNRRWIQEFEPVKLKRDKNKTIAFRQKGVYLVTGGLGGIGLILAEHLAKLVSARLVLIGRSHFPSPEQWQDWLNTHDGDDGTSQKILKLQALENSGAEVLVFSADVSNQEQMLDVIFRAEERFGRINGVIHAAGVLDEKSFVSMGDLSQSLCEEQFHPKIYGILALEKMLKGRELDFCLVMSSISAVLGGLGHAAYAAANIFMDAFVQLLNRTSTGTGTDKRTLNWMSVNWDTWQTGEGKKFLETAMTPAEGVEALERILSMLDQDQVVVSTGELQERINRWITLESIQGEKGAAPGPQPEQVILDLWKNSLGVEKLGLHDNFFDLGATSLDIIQVNRRLKKILRRNIPVDAMFEYPSIHALVEYLSNENEKGPDPDEMLNKAANKRERTLKTLRETKNDRNK